MSSSYPEPSASPTSGPSGIPSVTDQPSGLVGNVLGQQNAAAQWKAWWGYDNSSNSLYRDGHREGARESYQGAQNVTYTKDDISSWTTMALQNPPARLHLMQLALSTGFKPTNQGIYQMMDFAGQKSAAAYAATGPGVAAQKVTPFDILNLMSSNAAVPNAKKLRTTSTSRDVSYNISDPQTAKAITDATLTAALGREATPEELQSYKHALNAYERANPNISTKSEVSNFSPDGTQTSHSSTGTSTGGISVEGQKQIIHDKAAATTEGAAFQTQDLFEKAMATLANRIG